MRKILTLTIATIMSIAVLTGCGNSDNAVSDETSDRMYLTDNTMTATPHLKIIGYDRGDGMAHFSYYYDTDTGVIYAVCDGSNVDTIQPLYNADGTLRTIDQLN